MLNGLRSIDLSGDEQCDLQERSGMMWNVIVYFDIPRIIQRLICIPFPVLFFCTQAEREGSFATFEKKQDKKWSKKEEYLFEMLNRKCNVKLMKIDRNRHNT